MLYSKAWSVLEVLPSYAGWGNQSNRRPLESQASRECLSFCPSKNLLNFIFFNLFIQGLLKMDAIFPTSVTLRSFIRAFILYCVESVDSSEKSNCSRSAEVELERQYLGLGQRQVQGFGKPSRAKPQQY